MAYYLVKADYRPNNPKKPEYPYQTEKGKAYVKKCFQEWYPWLKVYEVREVNETELSEEQRKWVAKI